MNSVQPIDTTTKDTVRKELDYLSSLFNENQDTVTSLYASRHPAFKCPKDAIDFLLKKWAHHERSEITNVWDDYELTEEQLDDLATYGQFPQRPSDLFLKIYHGVLRSLEHDPLAGCVSPRLIGVSGVIPLTIISTAPDIMRHYHHVIVHAEKEILFATCWWQKGKTSNMMGNALRDLNNRAAENTRPVVVKIIIDHFTKRNLAHSHALLPPRKWTHCGLPPAEELPFLSIEVNCYHRKILGAFHSKFLIVDRKIALLNSNNIYDRPNLEMMVHYEGDIVHSFYDTFLITWLLPFHPDLACLQNEMPVSDELHDSMETTKIGSVERSLEQAIAQARLPLHSDLSNEHGERHPIESPLCSSDDDENSTSVAEMGSSIVDFDASSRLVHPLTARLNGCSPSAQGTRNAENLSADELHKLMADFTPFVFHTPHQPVPIALVSRPCHGFPGHWDTINPQNAAWFGAFRYAQRSIFIQTPMFNASKAIDGVLAACQRGVKVTLWLDLGYDALKEGFGTFQGGTNEHVAKKLYRKLKEHGNGAEKKLEIFWYTAKDQTRPFHFSEKKRNCHIKFMAIDDQIAILGSGNMDTQSWCHSQEINTMVDSPVLVKEWISALYQNQSTNEYGKLDDDGRWHDDT